MRAWPDSLPLLALHSGRFHPQWARYSLLSTPSGSLHIDPSGVARRLDRQGRTTPIPATSPLLAIRDCLGDSHSEAPANDEALPPFGSGWLGCFGYELGGLLEPAATNRGGPIAAKGQDSGGWPLVELARCEGALVYDALLNQWTATGAWATALPPLLTTALVAARARTRHHGGYELGEFRSTTSRQRHEDAVARAVEYTHAGDVFQANITRPLHAVFQGSSRALFLRSIAEVPAWYSSYLELPGGRCLLSLSPELFLQVDADGQVATRPIKGTRPTTATAGELLASAKDAAELNMIVDLCRNDLGRVCDLGSVRVTQNRTVETHPTVHHGVATIEGQLSHGCDICDLLQATFPAGSVTGAPKIRAMQIIEELEGGPRGPYCGCIGWLDDRGAARLSIAIRTLTLREGRRGETASVPYPPGIFQAAEAVYGVGGGIVADSDAAEEYEETQAKAAVLGRLIGRHDVEPHLAPTELGGSAEFACPPADLPL